MGSGRRGMVAGENAQGKVAHHDQPFGDVFRAPVARLAIAGPVVLLAEELSILLVVLVREGGATLTAPGGEGRG